jgi:hypothetical protein
MLDGISLYEQVHKLLYNARRSKMTEKKDERGECLAVADILAGFDLIRYYPFDEDHLDDDEMCEIDDEFT